MEDLFDGWLDVPTIAGFLAKAPADHARHPRHEALPHNREDDVGDATQDRGQTTSSDGTPAADRAGRQRQRHTKSRLGCITCKKRKIKCQETWPACANCIKRGSLCKYLPREVHRIRETSDSLNPRQLLQLSDTPNKFSSNDMRLFHHYLVSAYPTIPSEYEGVWLRDVPAYGYQYSYLMDAILALSASHLAIQVENPQEDIALQYRKKAIVGLEDAFTRWPLATASEAHIMLAASYLLCFQSSYMADGFLEHLMSLRGCAVLSQLIFSNGLVGPFTIAEFMNLAVMDMANKNFKYADQALTCAALESIRSFHHLLDGLDENCIEKALIAQFVGTVRPLLWSASITTSETDSSTPANPDLTDKTTASSDEEKSADTPRVKEYCLMNPFFPTHLTLSFGDIDWVTLTTPQQSHPDPVRSFNALMSTMLILSTWSHASFIQLFNPTNPLGNIILAHFCAVHFIISPLSALPSAMRTPAKAMVDWEAKLIAAVESSEGGAWAQYVAWPKKVLRCMQACVKRKRAFTFGDIRDVLLGDPGALSEGRAPDVQKEMDAEKRRKREMNPEALFFRNAGV